MTDENSTCVDKKIERKIEDKTKKILSDTDTKDSQPQSMAVDKAVDNVFDFFGKLRRLIMSRVLRPVGMVLLAIIKFFPGAIGKIADRLLSDFQSSIDKGNPLAIKTASLIKVIWLALRRCKRLITDILKLFSRKTATIRKCALHVLALAVGFIGGKLSFIGGKIAYFWHVVCDVTERYKRGFMFITASGLIIAICAVYTINSHTAYEYLYNGKTLGIVKDKDIVLSTIDLVGVKLSEAYGAHININTDTDITFNKVYITGEHVDDTEDVLQQLTYMKDMKVTGYVLVADGNELATFDSKETVEKLLDMVQQQFMDSAGQGKDYIDIGFSEDIRIDEIDTKLADLDKPEAILDHVLTGDVEQRYHTVEKGETLSGIANRNGLKTAEIMSMNPDIVPEKLQIGQEVKLEMLVPLLTVETTEIATYNEVVPYEIIYENTTAMYKGEQTVKLAGTKGERQVTAEITRQNGIETSKQELESITISEPTAQVVLMGSKELPPLIGQGYFKYPVRGRLTSRFGMRWGRMHNGIDLANSSGTPIYAADGGKVVSAGWAGSLGWTVVINHGGNRETLYGHCSKMLVKAGDKVYQGQHIANVGNTGNSTGPHLHFEVHVNGVAKNPLNYL